MKQHLDTALLVRLADSGAEDKSFQRPANLEEAVAARGLLPETLAARVRERADAVGQLLRAGPGLLRVPVLPDLPIPELGVNRP